MGQFHEYELPGEDLVLRGLQDLSRGEKTIESLLICIGGPRLKSLGFDFTPLQLNDFPEIHLYDLLEEQNPQNAHSTYNAYVRRLVSFEDSLENLRSKTVKRIKKLVV